MSEYGEIEIYVEKNVFNIVGQTLDILEEYNMIPAGKLVQIMKKMSSYMSQNDLRKNWMLARMFRKIVAQESNNKIYLKLRQKEKKDETKRNIKMYDM